MFGYKIKINTINLVDYPETEKYLEKMALKGWILKKIFGNSIFLFKKIEPEEISFTISPLVVETSMTKKTKEYLEGFSELAEETGWKYCCSTFNFHTYYGKKSDDLVPMYTDGEAEYLELKKMSRMEFIANIFIIIIMISLFKDTYNGYKSARFIEETLFQLIFFMAPLFLINTIIKIISTSVFYYRNRKIIEEEEDIKFIKSKFVKFNTDFGNYFLIIIGLMFLIYIFKTTFIERSYDAIKSLMPLALGLGIGTYINKKKKYKIKDKLDFGAIIVVTIIIAFISGAIIFPIIDSSIKDKSSKNIPENIIYLSRKDSSLKDEDIIKKYRKKSSIFVEESYEYSEYIEEGRYNIETRYTRTKSEDMAKKLIKGYIFDERENHKSFEEFVFKHTGKRNKLKKGQSKSEYINIEVDKIMEENIIKIDEKLWNVDEAYYLSSGKEIILLRKGREVYYLRGMKFSNDENRELVMERFGL